MRNNYVKITKVIIKYQSICYMSLNYILFDGGGERGGEVEGETHHPQVANQKQAFPPIPIG